MYKRPLEFQMQLFGKMKIFGFVVILFAIEFVCLFAQINDCDQGIKVEIENQDEFCAQNGSVIQINVTTTNIELRCPMDFTIGILNQPVTLQIGRNTILNENSITIQVMRYGHSGTYNCTENANPSNVLLIEIQATGVGMIIRDRKTPGPDFSIEFHQVLNSSVVYLACDRDIGIVFICESSYNDERFNINSDTTVSSSSQQNINEFEIGNNGEISDGGNQFVLTCQPKDENGNIQTLSITVMLTERLPDENCDDIFSRTPESNDNYQACLLEIGITSYPEIIPCINCFAIWTKTNGICYNVFKGGSKTWDSAQGSCMALGGYLAEIPNYFVQTIITKEVNSDCWIGLRRNGTTEEFRWRSGRELGEFNFWKDEMEPVNSDCVSLMGAMSEWDTRPCGNTLSCSICMLGSIYPPPMPIPQIGCNNGQVINGRCYQALNEQLSWQRAQLECELLGSNLIEITNEIVYNQIMNFFPESGPYWIGLRLNSMTSMYEWRSGIMLNDSFVKWQNVNPSTNNGNNNCAVAFGNGFWELRPCKDKLRYICQNESNPTVTVPIVIGNETKSNTSTTTTTTTVIATTTTNPPDEGEGDILEETDCNPSGDGILSEVPACIIFGQAQEQIFALEPADSIVEQIDGFLKSLLTTDINVGEIIKNQMNGTTLIVASIQANSNTNIIITAGVTIGVQSNSFSGNGPTIIAAITIMSDSEQLTQTTANQNIELVSDVCIVVSDKEVSGVVTIEFESNTQDEKLNISCYFYNTTTNTWSMEGIMTIVLASGRIQCITDHFTSFALLVTFQPSEALDEETKIIQAYVSTGLCSVSLLFLVGSLILYACVGKKFLSKDLNIIHLNYVIALILALLAFIAYSVLFFVKVKLDANNGICKAIAFFNHYFWLTVFSWNFCEAFHIVLALYSHRIPNKRHFLWLLAIGWGFPIPIVAITLGVAFNSYTNVRQEICFLNVDGGVIWAFLGPAYFIILVNTCVLIFVIAMTIYVQRKRSFKKYLCSLIIGTATTLPLLGLPWIAGLLPNLAGLLQDNSISWLSYIFIVLNASQGIVFFLIHVIRNDQVIAKLCNRSTIEFTEDSGNKNSQEVKIKNANDEINTSSRGTADPSGLANTTENGNNVTHEYLSTYIEMIGDIPCNIPIENPTYEHSYDIKFKN